MSKTALSVRIDADLNKQIEYFAFAKCCSKTEAVEAILSQYFLDKPELSFNPLQLKKGNKVKYEELAGKHFPERRGMVTLISIPHLKAVVIKVPNSTKLTVVKTYPEFVWQVAETLSEPTPSKLEEIHETYLDGEEILDIWVRKGYCSKPSER